MQTKLNRPGKAVRFSIGNQACNPISEAITASNIKNFKFEIRNNKLDQLQSMSAKMAANEILPIRQLQGMSANPDYLHTLIPICSHSDLNYYF